MLSMLSKENTVEQSRLVMNSFLRSKELVLSWNSKNNENFKMP